MDLRARILETRTQFASVTVPEWDGLQIWLRRLTLAEQLDFERRHGSLEGLDPKENLDTFVQLMVRYVIATTCDADGTPCFTPDDEAMIIQQLSGSAIRFLFNAAIKVNITPAAEVIDLGKGSGEARNGASPSGSPGTSA